MRTMKLKDEGERRSIRREMRIEKTEVGEVPTNERNARSDASKEGALANNRSTRKVHAAQRAR